MNSHLHLMEVAQSRVKPVLLGPKAGLSFYEFLGQELLSVKPSQWQGSRG